MRKFVQFLVLSAAAMLSACSSTKLYTSVSSFSKGTPPAGVSYILLPYAQGSISNSFAKLNEFEFNEYAAYIERGLSAKGWRRVPVNGTAHMVVFVAYGMGPPQEKTYTYSTPTWGQTGGGTAYTTGVASSFGGYTNLSATTTFVPNYGITGYQTHLGTMTTYDRWLRVMSFRMDTLAKTNQWDQVWDVSVKSTGTSNDLRAVMPYLAMSASQYAGVSSGRSVGLAYKQGGKEIRAFLAPPKAISAQGGVSNRSHTEPSAPVPAPSASLVEDRAPRPSAVSDYPVKPIFEKKVATTGTGQKIMDAAAAEGAVVRSRSIPNQ